MHKIVMQRYTNCDKLNDIMGKFDREFTIYANSVHELKAAVESFYRKVKFMNDIMYVTKEV